MSESNSMIHVGIDNGISGAIAAIRDGELYAVTTMPILKARKGNEIDVESVSAFLLGLKVRGPVTVLIEEPGGSKSAKAGASMAGSFHALRAIVTMMGFRWHRITPQQWAKVMMPGCKPGDTKPRAMTAAKALWPAFDFRASERCRIPHDGLIDAALIAEYGRRANL